MIELKATRLEIDGLEDMDSVYLDLELPSGVGRAAGLVKAYTAEEDPNKQLTRIEFVFTRDWLEKQVGGRRGPMER